MSSTTSSDGLPGVILHVSDSAVAAELEVINLAIRIN